MAIFNSYVSLPEGTERWNPTLAKSHLFPKAWGRCLASKARRSASARDRCAAKMLAQQVASQRAQVTATETWKDGELRWFKQQKPMKTRAAWMKTHEKLAFHRQTWWHIVKKR